MPDLAAVKTNARQAFTGRVRSFTSRIVEGATQASSAFLHKRGDAVAALPFKSEAIMLPPPLELNGKTIDVIDDLVAFTDLPRTTVEHELSNRSFRSEWHATPEELRSDHWFYLSAKGYLFANAIHFPNSELVDAAVAPHVPAGARVLDFGGGTGNLALMLAAHGYHATVIELSALQRDFIRFRVQLHGLGEHVTVADWWADPPAQSFDAVIAVDVLEHLPNAAGVIDDVLLRGMKHDGCVIENSPFVVNAANPMHHQDFGLDAHLAGHGLRTVTSLPDGTRVWSRA